jgi:predicted RNase H-like nuclease (RuvC/YqgF family)
MAEVFVSLFGAIGTVVASYYAYAAHKQGRLSGSAINEINDAVNHRHENGTPRLYDMVWSNFNRVSKLENSVAEIKQDVKHLSQRAKMQQSEIDKIEEQLDTE